MEFISFRLSYYSNDLCEVTSKLFEVFHDWYRNTFTKRSHYVSFGMLYARRVASYFQYILDFFVFVVASSGPIPAHIEW